MTSKIVAQQNPIKTRQLTKLDMLLLNTIMPNEKKLADCTGEECTQFSEIYEIFAAANVPPQNWRGEVLPITPLGCTVLCELFKHLAAEVGPKNKVGDIMLKRTSGTRRPDRGDDE